MGKPNKNGATTVKKYSCVIGGHKTSISVEREFWEGVKEICDVRDLSISEFIVAIDSKKEGNLSSAIRLEVLEFYQNGRKTGV